MDFSWDRDALDAELGACAGARGLVARIEPRYSDLGARGFAPSPTAEELWQRASEFAQDAPWALARRRWAFAILESDRLADARGRLDRAWSEDPSPVPDPEPGRYALADLRFKALSDPPRRARWLQAFAAASAPASDRFTRFWSERLELGESVGVDLLELDGVTPAHLELAERWIERTDAAHRELGLDVSCWLDIALARGATEGWPTQLSWRSVGQLLGANSWTGALRLRLSEPPRALGASSYCRAFRTWGMAWADAHLAQARPFIAWRDPTGLAERTRGALLALLPLSAEFMRRRQGLSRVRVRDQRRHVARAVLLASRWAALRTLLRGRLGSATLGARTGTLREHEELRERVLGFALPSTGAGTLPRLNALDHQEFSAFLLGSSRTSELVEQHDEDWFWNPRCSDVLRESFPIEFSAAPSADLASGSDALWAMLADALG